MPTIVEQLTIELGWDVSKFMAQAKDFEKVIKDRKEDFEKQSKIWESTLGNLGRMLLQVSGALLTIGAAIRGLDASRTISRTGADFANLADTLGMSVDKLSQWEQAIGRVGGNREEIKSAFLYQKEELMKFQMGLGAPSTEFMGAMQRLRMPDWTTYYNKATGNVDLDKFNRDLAAALQGINPETGKPFTASERAAYLKKFGVNSPAGQRLYSETLSRQLEATRPTAMTEENAAAFKRLNEAWQKLLDTAEAVKRDLITHLADPILSFLGRLQNALEVIRGVAPSLPAPAVPPPTGMSPPQKSITGEQRPFQPPAPTEPRKDWIGTPLPGSGGRLQSGAMGGQQPTGGLKPAGRDWWDWLLGRTPASPGAGAGSVAPNESPGNFNDRFAPFSKPQSSLEDIMGLPRSARYAGSTPVGNTSSTSTQSSLTIGGITFNSRTNDAMMGHAPSGLDKDLSVASYAVNFNEALI